MNYVIIAFYQFFSFSNFKEEQLPLKRFCKNRGIKGSILVAHEGINGTVAGSREAIDALLDYFANHLKIKNLDYKESFADFEPFRRTKVLLKKEIVASKVPDIADPTVHVGEYVKPDQWNEIITDPDTIVIDTRNDFECEMGTFEGAIDPKTKSFGEFSDYVDRELDPKKNKKVAMFCTGGIRCEKASAMMLSKGFENVYHLEGGILKYLEVVDEKDSKWNGECFVFDNRVSVKHGLGVGDYDMCHGCGSPIKNEEKSDPHYEEGVACPHCYGKRSKSQLARARERQLQFELAKTRRKKA